jgi:hypothetical protein
MRFSSLVDRVAGGGAGAWSVHVEARRRQEAGEDVIFLTVGDPDQEPPPVVIEATVAALRDHRTGYAPTIGLSGGSRSDRRARGAPQRPALLGRQCRGRAGDPGRSLLRHAMPGRA